MLWQTSEHSKLMGTTQVLPGAKKDPVPWFPLYFLHQSKSLLSSTYYIHSKVLSNSSVLKRHTEESHSLCTSLEEEFTDLGTKHQTAALKTLWSLLIKSRRQQERGAVFLGLTRSHLQCTSISQSSSTGGSARVREHGTTCQPCIGTLWKPKGWIQVFQISQTP